MALMTQWQIFLMCFTICDVVCMHMTSHTFVRVMFDENESDEQKSFPPPRTYIHIWIYIHIIVTTMHSLDLSVLQGDFDCWLSGVLEEFASQSPGWEVNVISLQHYDKMHWKKKGTGYQAPFLLIEIWGISSYGHIESTTLLKHVLFPWMLMFTLYCQVRGKKCHHADTSVLLSPVHFPSKLAEVLQVAVWCIGTTTMYMF